MYICASVCGGWCESVCNGLKLYVLLHNTIVKFFRTQCPKNPQNPYVTMSKTSATKIKYERCRLSPQLSLSLFLLFPESEGVLQGDIM